MRSVGPAGGPIEKIEWDGKQLRINDRWTLSVEPPPKAVSVGHEGDSGWKTQRPSGTKWSGKDGWGFARIELAAGRRSGSRSATRLPARPIPLVLPRRAFHLDLDLPDRRFVDCSNAQVAHLMMGLLDRRTPPGEPTNYPLAWQRDGVAVVAGLVRAGQLEVAKEFASTSPRTISSAASAPRATRRAKACGSMEDVAVPRAGSGVRPMALAARPAQSGDSS